MNLNILNLKLRMTMITNEYDAKCCVCGGEIFENNLTYCEDCRDGVENDGRPKTTIQGGDSLVRARNSKNCVAIEENPVRAKTDRRISLSD